MAYLLHQNIVNVKFHKELLNYVFANKILAEEMEETLYEVWFIWGHKSSYHYNNNGGLVINF